MKKVLGVILLSAGLMVCQVAFAATTAPLMISFSAPTEAYLGQFVKMALTASGGIQPHTYVWMFGDGTSSSTNVVHWQAKKLGVWPVTLAVKDGSGKVVMAPQHNITVKNRNSLYSRLSPNFSQYSSQQLLSTSTRSVVLGAYDLKTSTATTTIRELSFSVGALAKPFPTGKIQGFKMIVSASETYTSPKTMQSYNGSGLGDSVTFSDLNLVVGPNTWKSINIQALMMPSTINIYSSTTLRARDIVVAASPNYVLDVSTASSVIASTTFLGGR